jgi:hypothetical protein
METVPHAEVIMRSPATSPFTPGYGVLPQVWAGRDREFRDFDDTVVPRVRSRIYEQARVITGNRGVGKTVFLRQLADEAHDADDLVASATARGGHGVVADLVAALGTTLHAVSTAAAVSDLFDEALRRRIGLSVGTGGVRLDLGSRPSRGDLDALARSLAALMVRTAQEAAERGQLLLITVDEAQNADPDALAVLCHTLADVQNQHERTTGPRGEAVRAYLPLAVYLAGLPSLPERIRASGSTFFERALTFDFGLLRAPDVAAAIRGMLDNVEVGIEPDALDRLVDLVGGYPYFLHLYGKHAWAAGDGAVITAAEVEIAAGSAALDLARFYGERVRGLGDVAYDWLQAAARLPAEERTVGAVAAELGRTSSQLGSTVDSLIGRALIRHEPGRGRFSFALPGLDRYLADADR